MGHAPVTRYVLRRRVQFHEVDSVGIVHFGCYFRYMEEAEHALWREAGLSIAAPDASVGFPRVAASFEYHQPLRFEDEFEARIEVTKVGLRSIHYSCLLTRGDRKIATGTLTIVCVSKGPNDTMTSVPIPPDIAGRFTVPRDSDD
jgi:acyl-CoA thioester hydrolase